VWGVHGVGGALGIVLLGIFASTAFNPAGTDGLLFGNAAFLVKQLVAAALSSVWAFAFTYGMLWFIDRLTVVKVDQAAEERGLDAALHGETAYLGTE
jgi:Amt family ammonium transporter